MGEDRRLVILAEAVHTAAELGFKKANARTVAERLGMRPSNVFYYFKTEENLITELLSYIVSTNAQIVGALLAKKSASTHAQNLDLYLKGNVEWALSYPEQVTVLVYGLAEGRSRPDLRHLLARALDTGEQKIYAFIAGGLAEGEFKLKNNLKPREAAQLIHQALMGHIIRSLADLKPSSKKNYEIRLQAVVEACLLRD